MNYRWYKEAIIYSLDVDTFKDGNGDGIGDFQGLKQACRYLSGLGLNCLWLLPFYPSPNRDNGYDVMDHYCVNSRLGTMGDFTEFMEEADKRQIRVLADLVINHTSTEHPWFKEACSSRSSPFHEYYVWRYDEPPSTSEKATFPPEQKGIWSYKEQVKAWYMHRFYSHQPDLNISSAAVRAEIKKIMQFWLRLGISGFRVDAVPFLVEVRERAGKEVELRPEYNYLSEFRDAISWAKGDAIMLAEANVSRDEQVECFGDGDRMHMVFNFLVNQQTFLALASNSAEPLAHALERMPDIPKHAQWGMFLRNHDELTLDRLSPEQRELCFSRFAPDEKMRIFNRGVRRRLAPILGGDRRKILLAHSLLFSLPGTPVLWYGEEIGMGDNLALPGRFSVRTPMQWSPERNAGFSSAAEENLLRPVTSAGAYSFERVNVALQERDDSSLLNSIQQMIRVRQHKMEFNSGRFRLLKTTAPREVLAHCSCRENELCVAVHNFCDAGQRFTLHIDGVESGVASDVLSFGEHRIEKGTCALELEPHGFLWMKIKQR